MNAKQAAALDFPSHYFNSKLKLNHSICLVTLIDHLK